MGRLPVHFVVKLGPIFMNNKSNNESNQFISQMSPTIISPINYMINRLNTCTTKKNERNAEVNTKNTFATKSVPNKRLLKTKIKQR
jgi:hypothetical protein